jgi:hypothetical protein
LTDYKDPHALKQATIAALTDLGDYPQDYFRPAMDNIQENKGDINDVHLATVCCQILEEAKKNYCTDQGRATPDVPDNVSEAGSSSNLLENRAIRETKVRRSCMN